MAEHRIERSAGDEDEIFDLAPEEPPTPHPALSRPPRDAKIAAAAAKPRPCPNCGYDLSGLAAHTCPECGTKMTYSQRAKIRDAQSNTRHSMWFDTEAVVWAVIGIAIGLTVWCLSEGFVVGAVAFSVNFVVTVVIGWIVFFICSMMWIGFDQPLRKTVVQLTGAYGAYAGFSSIAAIVPLFGLLIQLFAWLGLIGMLAKLLDIDGKDAFVIALFSGVIKVLLAGWLITMLIQSAGTP